MSVVEANEVIDLEGDQGRADAALEIIRARPEPRQHAFSSLAEHDAALIAEARAHVRAGCDLAAPCLTRRDAEECARALSSDGFETLELDEHRGVTSSAVKVGTIKRAKGLEFKQVLLARVDGALLAPVASGLEDGALVRREVERRSLYVGMPRARKGLWVGSSAPNRIGTGPERPRAVRLDLLRSNVGTANYPSVRITASAIPFRSKGPGIRNTRPPQEVRASWKPGAPVTPRSASTGCLKTQMTSGTE